MPERPTDEQLDREFAWTSWGTSCRDTRAANRACRRPAGHTGDHASGFGAQREIWPRAAESTVDGACDLCGTVGKRFHFGDDEHHLWLCGRCHSGRF